MYLLAFISLLYVISCYRDIYVFNGTNGHLLPKWPVKTGKRVAANVLVTHFRSSRGAPDIVSAWNFTSCILYITLPFLSLLLERYCKCLEFFQHYSLYCFTLSVYFFFRKSSVWPSLSSLSTPPTIFPPVPVMACVVWIVYEFKKLSLHVVYKIKGLPLCTYM